jgi:hypothetical protein
MFGELGRFVRGVGFELSLSGALCFFTQESLFRTRNIFLYHMSEEKSAPAFLGGLGGIKLRKTEVVHDASAPKLKGPQLKQSVFSIVDPCLTVNPENSNQSYRFFFPAGVLEAQEVDKWHNKVLDINMEEWLDLIPNETFATEYFELTVAHAKTFVAAYECRHVQKPALKELPHDLEQKMSEIEAGLQKTIDSVRGSAC